MVFFKLPSFFLIISPTTFKFFFCNLLNFFLVLHSPFFYPFMFIIVDDSRPFFSHRWLIGLFVSLSHRKRHRRGAWSSPTVVSFSLWVYHWQLHLPLTTCIFFNKFQARGAQSSLGFFSAFDHGSPLLGSSKLLDGGLFSLLACPTGEFHAPSATCFLKKKFQARGARSSSAFFFCFSHDSPLLGSLKLPNNGLFSLWTLPCRWAPCSSDVLLF